MKVGYQGVEYSNSHFIAKKFVEKNKINDYDLIPLVDSYKVYDNLINNNIDYGVMAIYNIIGKEVLETMEVLKHNKLVEVERYDEIINHCLFKKSKDVNIKGIASHIQALSQTSNIRNKLYPNMKEIIVDDTALAAKYLKEGKLEANIAVICSKEAGIKNGLFLINENFQDCKRNITTFGIYKCKI